MSIHILIVPPINNTHSVYHLGNTASPERKVQTLSILQTVSSICSINPTEHALLQITCNTEEEVKYKLEWKCQHVPNSQLIKEMYI